MLDRRVLASFVPGTDKIVEDITLQSNNSAGARVRFSPDGSKIVTDNSGHQLVNILSASDLHGKQLVVPVGKAPMGVGFGPDNRTLLVGNHGDGTVSVIDMQDGKKLKRFHAGAGIETMTWYWWATLIFLSTHGLPEPNRRPACPCK
ncbi:MAG TPA: hypothetical protein VGL82_01000 [Bryobacteraceae bacterium]|jgi:DNA-binding beta-propeller fold protein YncE